MNILCIIPARGGSKRVSQKNIRKLNGKPLVEYSIRQAKQSKYINRIIVSTDNSKIAKISKILGAEVPFLRPKKISTDFTPLIDVIKHSIKYLKGNECYVPDIIVVLQPTSPIRKIEKIDESIRILKKTKCTSVITVSEVKTHPFVSFWYEKNLLKPYDKNFEKLSIRQQRKPIYHPTGSIYTLWCNTLKKYDSVYGPLIRPIIVKEKNEIVDIDEVFDFFVCEMTIKNWFRFKKMFLV